MALLGVWLKCSPEGVNFGRLQRKHLSSVSVIPMAAAIVDSTFLVSGPVLGHRRTIAVCIRQLFWSL